MEKCTVCDIISVILSILSLIFTIYISKKISWEQFYSSLMTEYRSIEFGRAMQNVIHFYTETCGSDVNRIQEEYEKKFKEEVLLDKNENSLHYDRRLLAQFFVDLDKCASTPWYYIGKKRVIKDFTSGTKNLVAILYFMGCAIDSSTIIFKELEINERIPKYKNKKGMNKYLLSMHETLTKSKKYMQ